jgi:TRAP-type C4-dicarboxylate transport system permease small subunit
MQAGPSFAAVRRPQLARIIVDNFEELVAAALLAVIGVVMALQVCLRSFFNAPLSWPEELSQFLFVWCSALGAVGAGKRHGLVRLEAVAEKLVPPLRAALDYLILALIAVLLGILCWKGWQLGARTSFTATTLPLTWAWLYAAAPAFSILMVARLFQLQVLRYRFIFIESLIAEKRIDAGPAGSIQ